MRRHIVIFGLLATTVVLAALFFVGRASSPASVVVEVADRTAAATATAVVAAKAAPAWTATPSATALAPVILVPPPSGDPPEGRGVEAPSSASAAVVLLDDASGAILLERNGHQPLPPASLTKIATAIVAIERGDLDATVEVDVDFRTMRGSTVMGLEPGDRFSLRDLLYGLMLPSGNDAALAIGRHIAGTDASFVEMMNALATRLGLRESRFINSHGLGGVGHMTSAYDLAKLSRYAMTLPAYREVAGADRWVARGSRELTLYSLVTEERWNVAGVDTGKTGYTWTAGRTLALTAKRDGHRLHVVVLNDPQTERVAAALLEWGFANFEWATAPTVVAGALASELAP